MLDRIKALFDEAAGSGSENKHHGMDALQLAAAVLLVEAARMDHAFDDTERTAVGALLRSRFALTDDEADALVEVADEEVGDAVEIYGYARRIKDHFCHEERIELIEMLWEVVYADGVLHDHEANLLRRVAGLIYVSDRESGAARKRVLERLGIG